MRFPALGGHCEIQFSTADERAAKAFLVAATSWVAAFEAKYTRYHPESLIGRINAAAGRNWVELDLDAERMFALADQIHVLTRGIIDISMLPLVRLWNYSVPEPRVPTPDEVRACAAMVGWGRVRREPGRIYLPEAGMGLDLGGIGREYAADRVADLARSHGIGNVLVDFGHDVRVCGAPADAPCWRIGVEDPRKPRTVRARLVLNDGGVATSGDYLRYFESNGRRFGHVIDPRSGYPVANGCVAVTVVASSCLEAGLLATAAFVLGPTDGLALIEEYAGAEGILYCEDREIPSRGYYRHAI